MKPSARFFLTRSAALSLPTSHSADAPAQLPDILLIAVDDLNDWIGCLGGHPQTKTPHFDRLAAGGVLFSNAYCAGASCNPSRVAVMTGLPPHRQPPFPRPPVRPNGSFSGLPSEANS